jgi:hypothetical protein
MDFEMFIANQSIPAWLAVLVALLMLWLMIRRDQ